MVSLLGDEREEDATALFSFVLRNLDREGRQIDDYDSEKNLTGINVCPHWIHDIFTITPKGNNKNS